MFGSSKTRKNADLKHYKRLDLIELLVNDMETIESLNKELDEKKQKLDALIEQDTRLKIKLDEKDEQLERLKQRLNEKDAQIEHLKDRLNKKDVAIAQLKEGLERAKEMIIKQGSQRQTGRATSAQTSLGDVLRARQSS